MVERARHVVNDAEQAERVPVGGDERRGGVKTDVRLVDDVGVVGKLLVQQGVLNDEEVGLEDGLSAEGRLARHFSAGKADFRFEPHAVRIHETDDRDGRLTDVGGEARDVVEGGFGGGVEDRAFVQRGESLRLSARNRGFRLQ